MQWMMPTIDSLARPAGASCWRRGSSIDYDPITDPHCSWRSNHGVHPSAREVTEITDLQPIIANDCPKNIRILG
jgi:hypothetical protein